MDRVAEASEAFVAHPRSGLETLGAFRDPNRLDQVAAVNRCVPWSATLSSNVGTYALTGSGLTANHGNYIFVQAAANPTAFTINPALLTITGNNTSRAFGLVNPALSATYTDEVGPE